MSLILGASNVNVFSVCSGVRACLGGVYFYLCVRASEVSPESLGESNIYATEVICALNLLLVCSNAVECFKFSLFRHHSCQNSLKSMFV